MYILTCSKVHSHYVLQLLTLTFLRVKMNICDLCNRTYKTIKCLKRHIKEKHIENRHFYNVLQNKVYSPGVFSQTFKADTFFSQRNVLKRQESAQRVKEEGCEKQIDKPYPYYEDISSDEESLQQLIESVPEFVTDSNNNTFIDSFLGDDNASTDYASGDDKATSVAYYPDVASVDVAAGEVTSGDVSFGDSFSGEVASGNVSADDVASGDVYADVVACGDVYSSEVSSGDAMATVDAHVASVDVSFGDVSFGDVSSGEVHSVDMDAAEAEYSDVAFGDEDCEVKITSINLTLTKTETIKNAKYLHLLDIRTPYVRMKFRPQCNQVCALHYHWLPPR